MKNISRHNFGNYAGWTYLSGNLVLTAKGAIETTLHGDADWMDYFTADPLASFVGVLFIIGSSMMGRAGGNTRGFRHSQCVALAAYVLLVVNLILQDKAMIAVMGTLLGTAGCAWSIYKTLRQEKAAYMPSSTPSFKILQDFPYLPTGVLDVSSHVLMGTGALMSVRPDPVLCAIAFFWGIGALFIALAAPHISNQTNAITA